MKTQIYLYGTRLYNTAVNTGVLPGGWYSQCQEGSHENQHTVLRFESSNKNRTNLPPFTYWHDYRLINWDEEEIADNID